MTLPIKQDIALRELLQYLEDQECNNFITERVKIIHGFVKTVPISSLYSLNNIEQLKKFIPKLSPMARKASERFQRSKK